MSKFLQYINDLQKVGGLSKHSLDMLEKKYENLDDNHKSSYDRLPEKALENYLNLRGYDRVIPIQVNVNSIKKNVQFLAWILIIDIFAQILIYLI